MAIKRVTDLFPQLLADELARLHKLDPNWCAWRHTGNDNEYQIRCRYTTWARKLWRSGVDGFGMWAGSAWIGGGPKIFVPTAEQCRALEQVEVRVELGDYAQPYPAILVDLSDLPDAPYAPFTAVLMHRVEGAATASLFSVGHLNDIVTTIAADGRPMEVSLLRFDADCAATAPVACRALRVAVNACLALVNYGCHASYLLPREVDSDRRLAASGGQRSAKARARLARQARLVTFAQEVRLHRSEGMGGDAADPTAVASDRQVATHWRRGHWHTVPYGPGKTLRRLVLYKPVLVRGDRAVDGAEITTTYRG